MDVAVAGDRGVGVVLGIDRTLKPRKQESKLLQVVSSGRGAAGGPGRAGVAGGRVRRCRGFILLMLALGFVSRRAP
jgi:hypothetical protein